MTKTIFHGEIIARQINELPKQINRIEPQKGYIVVGESEVTGNDHRVKINNGVKFYEKDGTLYASVLEPTIIECVFTERHDTIELPIGNWEFKKALEFDPLEQELRNVAD